ncbi:MAG: pantoate--beta-alanine ligase [Anaerolineales bacterium]|nr:MAG: pantoate--beta-alanine ligase [Anaerolineales bacterium]
MKVVTTLAELGDVRATLPSPFGLVPTMGYLHQGHLSLVRRARAECASVGVTIYVNPAQFSANDDLDSYPRDFDRDLRLLEAEGVDLVWAPADEDMYPPDFQTWVEVEALTRPLEGTHRPGHFRGVTTVVTKLFNATQPDKAYFGQKDAQQAVVIRRMVQDLNFPLKVVVCPTVREPDGLAMSSRNSYLDPQQREAATVLYRALTAANQAFSAGEREAEVLRHIMSEVLSTESLALALYISVADPDTLTELTGTVECALLSMAVYVGKTRLIDNIVVGDKGSVIGEK